MGLLKNPNQLTEVKGSAYIRPPPPSCIRSRQQHSREPGDAPSRLLAAAMGADCAMSREGDARGLHGFARHPASTILPSSSLSTAAAAAAFSGAWAALRVTTYEGVCMGLPGIRPPPSCLRSHCSQQQRSREPPRTRGPHPPITLTDSVLCHGQAPSPWSPVPFAGLQKGNTRPVQRYADEGRVIGHRSGQRLAMCRCGRGPGNVNLRFINPPLSSGIPSPELNLKPPLN